MNSERDLQYVGVTKVLDFVAQYILTNVLLDMSFCHNALHCVCVCVFKVLGFGFGSGVRAIEHHTAANDSRHLLT